MGSGGSGWATVGLAVALALATSVAARAEKRQVEVRNDTAFAIYRVNAWAEDFLPNGFNLMPLALQPNESRTIEINDDFNKCRFTIVADFRNPRRKFANLRELRRFPEPEWFREINLCVGDTKVLRVRPRGGSRIED